jgi:hypothetical protein
LYVASALAGHLGPPGDVKPDLTVPDQRAALAEALEHRPRWTERDGQSKGYDVAVRMAAKMKWRR